MTVLASLPGSWLDAIQFNPPSFGSIVALLIALLGLIFSAFNSGSEIAYFSLTREEVNSIDDENVRTRIANMLKTPEKLLATILIGNNLVNVMIVILLNFAVSKMLTFSSPVAAFIIETVLFTFLLLLFGEVMPKLYASSNNLKFAQFVSASLSGMMTLFNPVSRLMVKSTFIVNRMVTKHSDNISTEDLSRALEVSDVDGKEEKDLLQGILEFSDKSVADIMRPRLDVVDIDIEDDFDRVVKIVIEGGYSRMPVCEGDLDHVRGLLYAKDLLPYIGKHDKDFRWQSLLREAYFVPETRSQGDLLEDFRRKKIHMAIIVDEFGCTQGIATLEDILEEIVGDIDDEYDTEEKLYSRVNANTFVFSGKIPLDDFYEALETDEREFGDAVNDAETLAGLLLNLKGNFLAEKESVSFGRYDFTVTKVIKHRIVKVRVSINDKTSASVSQH